MKEPKITITGIFPSTGEEWAETANNKKEFEFILDKINSNFENCGMPRYVKVRGKAPKKVPKYVLNFLRDSAIL